MKVLVGPWALKALLVGFSLGATNCESTGVGNPPADGAAIAQRSEELLLQDGTEAMEAGGISSLLTTVPLLGLARPQDLSSPRQAALVASQNPDRFFITSCATTSVGAQSFTQSFQQCNLSLFGLGTLTGQLETIFRVGTGGAIIADIRGQSLALDDAIVELKSTVNLAFSGATRLTTCVDRNMGQLPTLWLAKPLP